MRVTFPMALGLLFLALKLTGYIDWSWWLVLLPFYLPLSIALVAFMAFLGLKRCERVQADRRRAAFLASRRRS